MSNTILNYSDDITYREGDIVNFEGILYQMTDSIGVPGFDPPGYLLNWKVYILKSKILRIQCVSV